jgi:cleavage and polyadenylation specificity factor subunit 1
MEFLGHIVDTAGAWLLADKFAAIKEIQQHTCVKELEGFLGIITFYKRFLRQAARILVPSTDALKGSTKGVTPIAWTPARQEEFDVAKMLFDTAFSPKTL